MSDIREVKESPIVQGEDEKIAYTLTTTPWGSSPSNVSVTMYEYTDNVIGTNVSATRMDGAAAISGDVITTPVISVVANTNYRLEIKFTVGGNELEAFAVICGEK